MAGNEEDVRQKWIKLALLKCSLRYGLLSFEHSMCYVPHEDREKVWYDFLKLKDVLWQAVGAMHGNIASATVPVIIEVKVRFFKKAPQKCNAPGTKQPSKRRQEF